jgi:hypothetical protein
MTSSIAFAQSPPQTRDAASKDGANPVCVEAWNALSEAKQLKNVRTLKENNCQIIHDQGWLPGAGVKKPEVCTEPWNALTKAKMAKHGKTLVSNNCAVMAKNGWK